MLGWWLGGKVFRREMRFKKAGKLGYHHSGEGYLERATAKAEPMLEEELERRGWRPSELVSRRKNDPEQLELAARLWRETTLSMKAIAARVYLGIS